MPVEVVADGIGRFAQDAEAAVYFSCLEALQNVSKYAHAKAVRIDLRGVDGHLEFRVHDDGDGFDPTATGYGTGLQGIADRLSVLEGSLVVTSAPRRGHDDCGVCLCWWAVGCVVLGGVLFGGVFCIRESGWGERNVVSMGTFAWSAR